MNVSSFLGCAAVACFALTSAVSADGVADSERHLGVLPVPSMNVPAEWITPSEASDFKKTPRYVETMQYCRRLADSSEWIDYQSFGTSPEGRDLVVLVVSKDGAFTPKRAKEIGKPIIMVQNCIHSGECAGKDASLMLLRDLAITKQHEHLLDHATLLVIPIFSADSHERFSPYSRVNQVGPEAMGWRTTSTNMNLNRDYVKADAVEMRAWLDLFNAWRPHLHIDNHSTDGGDWQYDIMLAVDRHAAAAESVVKYLDDLYPSVLSDLRDAGHLPMTYFGLVDSKDPRKGIRSGGFGPRYSTGYLAIRNRPSFLVETHALKTYRRRVIAHYSLMRSVLERVNRDPAFLLKAVSNAEKEISSQGATYDPNQKWTMTIKRTGEGEQIVFKGFDYTREQSEVSGDVRIIYDATAPIEFEATWFNKTRGNLEICPPLAYVIPPQWTEIIDLVRSHGLRCERLTEAVTAEVESYKFEDVSFADRPYEGRVRAKYKTVPIAETRTLISGSVVVRLNQPDAKVAVHLLEPEAPDAAVAWGFLNAIFEQKEYGEHYVLEKLARSMMAENPKLKEEFEALLASDPAFAADPMAKLYFFYTRSPYWDEQMNVYPISRITTPQKMRTEPLP